MEIRSIHLKCINRRSLDVVWSRSSCCCRTRLWSISRWRMNKVHSSPDLIVWSARCVGDSGAASRITFRRLAALHLLLFTLLIFRELVDKTQPSCDQEKTLIRAFQCSTVVSGCMLLINASTYRPIGRYRRSNHSGRYAAATSNPNHGTNPNSDSKP